MSIEKYKLYKKGFDCLINSYLIIDDNKLSNKQKIKEINKIRDKYIIYIQNQTKFLYSLNQIIDFYKFFSYLKSE